MAGRTSIHDPAALESWFRERRAPPEVVRRVRSAFYRRLTDPEAPLPEALRADWRREIEAHALTLVETAGPSADGATRLLLATRGGARLETAVLRIASGRATVCVSSQVGCAARCRFCATGAMGVAIDLSPAEILDQLVHANHLLRPAGRRARNVVFMGMGEPLHNAGAVGTALDAMLAPWGFGLAPRHVTVSTVGIPDAMRSLAERHPTIGFAVSLHAARTAVRERLVPLARRHRLPELREAIREVAARSDRRVMLQYLLLAGENDGPDDLAALLAFVRDLPVRVNLIPYNPTPVAPELRATAPEGRARFARVLREAGFEVTTRRSLGAEIEVACGQLARGGRP